MKGIIPNGKNTRVFEIGTVNKTELKVTIKNSNWLDKLVWSFDGNHKYEESSLIFMVILEDEERGSYIKRVSEKRFVNEYDGDFSKMVDEIIIEYKDKVYFNSFEKYSNWCTVSEVKKER